MKDIKFRDLLPSEIDLRVGTVNAGKGFSLLLYKDARVDANILDETVGAFNWQKKFYQVKNTMICSLGINMNYDDETKDPYWVWKDDAGDESNTEAVKGEASDSFKRAGFAFGGLGRKLYTSPFVWIKEDSDNNPKTSRYSVKEIDYDEKSITKLVIVNDKTKQIVFSYGSSEKVAPKAQETPNNGKATNNQSVDTKSEDKKIIDDYINSLTMEQFKKFEDYLEKRFLKYNIGELTKEEYHALAVSISQAK